MALINLTGTSSVRRRVDTEDHYILGKIGVAIRYIGPTPEAHGRLLGRLGALGTSGSDGPLALSSLYTNLDMLAWFHGYFITVLIGMNILAFAISAAAFVYTSDSVLHSSAKAYSSSLGWMKRQINPLLHIVPNLHLVKIRSKTFSTKESF
jgi:hypothetical protein